MHVVEDMHSESYVNQRAGTRRQRYAALLARGPIRQPEWPDAMYQRLEVHCAVAPGSAAVALPRQAEPRYLHGRLSPRCGRGTFSPLYPSRCLPGP